MKYQKGSVFMSEYNQSNDTGYHLKEEYDQMYNERMSTHSYLLLCRC